MAFLVKADFGALNNIVWIFLQFPTHANCIPIICRS